MEYLTFLFHTGDFLDCVNKIWFIKMNIYITKVSDGAKIEENRTSHWFENIHSSVLQTPFENSSWISRNNLDVMVPSTYWPNLFHSMICKDMSRLHKLKEMRSFECVTGCMFGTCWLLFNMQSAFPHSHSMNISHFLFNYASFLNIWKEIKPHH